MFHAKLKTRQLNCGCVLSTEKVIYPRRLTTLSGSPPFTGGTQLSKQTAMVSLSSVHWRNAAQLENQTAIRTYPYVHRKNTSKQSNNGWYVFLRLAKQTASMRRPRLLRTPILVRSVFFSCSQLSSTWATNTRIYARKACLAALLSLRISDQWSTDLCFGIPTQ